MAVEVAVAYQSGSRKVNDLLCLGSLVKALSPMHFYPNKVGQTNTWFTKESEQMISRKQSIRHKKNSEIEKSEFEEITPDNTKTCAIM